MEEHNDTEPGFPHLPADASEDDRYSYVMGILLGIGISLILWAAIALLMF
jgi:hypothetical protein